MSTSLLRDWDGSLFCPDNIVDVRLDAEVGVPELRLCIAVINGSSEFAQTTLLFTQVGTVAGRVGSVGGSDVLC